MSRAASLATVAAAAGLLLGASEGARPLDDFEDVSAWRAAPADGVALGLSAVAGVSGRALRMDFDFRGRGGYVVARRPMEITFPENYELSLSVRGHGLENVLEIKFVDASGDNVWWVRRPGFAPPGDWTRLTFRKRHVRFAWGPLGQREGGPPPLSRSSSLEIVVAAAEGGAGFLEVDELTLLPLPPDRPYAGTPAAKASSSAAGHDAARAIDGRPETSWRSDGPTASLEVDFQARRELGALSLLWEPGRRARRYALEASTDGSSWKRLREVPAGRGSKDELYLPETDARWLRFAFADAEGPEGFGLSEIFVRPLSAGESVNDFFLEIAKDAPRGAYPRGFSGEQVYWTVAGVDGDAEEVLISEDGAIEPGERSFSIEPFLLSEGRLWSWADVTSSQSLREGHLPIPTVSWTGAPFGLEVTVLVDGAPGVATVRARYRVTNPSPGRLAGKLFLAVRPLLVNPPTQFLNVGGGAVAIRTISASPTAVEVDGRRTVRAETPASAAGAAPFEAGLLVDHFGRGQVPEAPRVEDSFGYASAALAWDLDLPPATSREVILSVPLSAGGLAGEAAPPPGRSFEAALEAAAASWRESTGGVSLALGGSRELSDTLAANLAAILVNRDGPAIQPGSRAYARSWIRDGALTSTALLRLGHFEEVREFLLWYAPYQYPDGKVPCCVDRRGADPVPENDSHGELLYLAAEYLLYTGDLPTVRHIWPHAVRGVAYMDALRASRRTAAYRSGAKRAYFGLLPESISHEGYSAKPVHSYWDQIWALKGYQAAVLLAQRLDENNAARRFAASRDEFRTDLKQSLSRVIADHRLAYIPGSVELADYDATSTTIALAPWSCRDILPEEALRGTFERYLAEFETRRRSEAWEAYTPYEWRTVGTLVRLGRREAIPGIVEFFVGHRRPSGWRHWAEVVGRLPREPRFIGDMPHTWVGSDFIRSLLDMLAYEREDGALVLAAGVPTAWAQHPDGIGVRGLRTPWGVLDYSLRRDEGGLTLTIGAGLRVPPGGVVLAWPIPEGATATIDGKPVVVRGSEVRIASLPAVVKIP